MLITKAIWMAGTALFGTVSVIAGRTFFPNKEQEVVFYETVSQIMARMERFKSNLKDGDVVPVSAFPMPGETMVWLTPRDGNQWKAKFNTLQRTGHMKFDNDLELRKWCQIQKEVTMVHIVKKPGKPFQLKMSADSQVNHSYLIQATDLLDLKNFCSRPITNKEWFGRTFRNSKDIKVEERKVGGIAQSCEYWMKQPYSTTNVSALEPCLRFGVKETEAVDYGIE